MKDSFNNLIQTDTPVLVDFFAQWCGPCQTMMPVLSEVKEALGDQIKIIKIDVDKNQQLAAQYQVRGVPTFIVFKHGELLWRQSGLISRTDLIKKLQSFA
jgi:thioredoxin 1